MTVFFGDGTSQTSAAGASKLVQTVTANSKTSYSFTSQTYVDTDVTVNITPTSSSNKVLISCTLATQCYATNSTSLGVRLMRGSTAIWNNNEFHWHSVNAAINLSYSSFFQFLDTPSTTSQITYKLQGSRYRVSNGTQQAHFNYIPSNSSHGCIIIAQEMTP